MSEKTVDSLHTELVLVEVAGKTLGVPVERVRYALPPQRLDGVPLAPAAVAGVVNLRGRVAVAIDLRCCLEGEASTPPDQQQCLVIEMRGELYALLVDSVGEVVRFGEDAVIDDSIDAFAPRWQHLLCQLLRMEEGIVAELDIERVLEMTCSNSSSPSTSGEANREVVLGG